MSDIRLYGRILVKTNILAVTGLHIGGSGGALEIGGVDNPVIRDPLTQQPYLPGSSLRGKMRSLLEKALGLRQNRPIGQAKIHTCKTEADFEKCDVCHIFGVPGEGDISNATLLYVRDAKLHEDCVKELTKAHTDTPFGELKTEVAIDRVTSAAVPRQLERVPAGAVFGPAELVFNIYSAADFARFKVVLDGLQLVEDDYLGGSGSRGSGKVKFEKIEIAARASGADYSQLVPVAAYPDLAALLADYAALDQKLRAAVPVVNG